MEKRIVALPDGIIHIVLAVALFTIASVSCDASDKGDRAVEQDMQTVENIRAQYDTRLMAIDGVVSVSTGICASGKPCLKIGTSVPTEQVRAKLPKDLFQVEVELEYIGEIRAQ